MTINTFNQYVHYTAKPSQESSGDSKFKQFKNPDKNEFVKPDKNIVFKDVFDNNQKIFTHVSRKDLGLSKYASSYPLAESQFSSYSAPTTGKGLCFLSEPKLFVGSSYTGVINAYSSSCEECMGSFYPCGNPNDGTELMFDEYSIVYDEGLEKYVITRSDNPITYIYNIIKNGDVLYLEIKKNSSLECIDTTCRCGSNQSSLSEPIIKPLHELFIDELRGLGSSFLRNFLSPNEDDEDKISPYSIMLNKTILPIRYDSTINNVVYYDKDFGDRLWNFGNINSNILNTMKRHGFSDYFWVINPSKISTDGEAVLGKVVTAKDLDPPTYSGIPFKSFEAAVVKNYCSKHFVVLDQKDGKWDASNVILDEKRIRIYAKELNSPWGGQWNYYAGLAKACDDRIKSCGSRILGLIGKDPDKVDSNFSDYPKIIERNSLNNVFREDIGSKRTQNILKSIIDEINKKFKNDEFITNSTAKNFLKNTDLLFPECGCDCGLLSILFKDSEEKTFGVGPIAFEINLPTEDKLNFGLKYIDRQLFKTQRLLFNFNRSKGDSNATFNKSDNEVSIYIKSPEGTTFEFDFPEDSIETNLEVDKDIFDSFPDEDLLGLWEVSIDPPTENLEFKVTLRFEGILDYGTSINPGDDDNNDGSISVSYCDYS